jgi:hypothetical protein
MTTKKQYGQFYTTNYQYILQNMAIPEDVEEIVEPFAGNGDLLNFAKDYKIKCYDIDPKKDFIIKQDTLKFPPYMKDKFVLTNPPYLARNKSTNKELYDKYNTNDLYKCFIEIILTSECSGGILIIPLNFISSIRKNDINLRKRFTNKYDITTMNIFEEQVFDDTSYTICSLQFSRKKHDNNQTNAYIYSKTSNVVQIQFELTSQNNYTIGGEIYNLKQSTDYKIERATRSCSLENCTNILVKCIDDSVDSKIRMSIVDDNMVAKYIDKTPKLSARSYAILIIEPMIEKEKQIELVDRFNAFLNKQRERYNSLFLANYRECNSVARKRISFGLVYEICNYLLSDDEP